MNSCNGPNSFVNSSTCFSRSNNVLLLDARHALLKLVWWRGEFSAEIEQIILDMAQARIEIGIGIHGPNHANGRVQFVHRAVSPDTRRIFADASATGQPRCAVIAGARDDIGKPRHLRSALLEFRRDQAHKLKSLVTGVFELVLFVGGNVKHVPGLIDTSLPSRQTVPCPSITKISCSYG